MDDPMRVYFEEGAVATVDSFPQTWRLSLTELETSRRVLAAEAARELFLRFGKNLPVKVLTEWQATFRSYLGL
jgi:hypothetical protein